MEEVHGTGRGLGFLGLSFTQELHLEDLQTPILLGFLWRQHHQAGMIYP